MLKIVGKQDVDYISRKTNQPVVGITLHCLGKNSRVDGESVETVFVSARADSYDFAKSQPIGGMINVSYNRWGNVDNVYPASNK